MSEQMEGEAVEVRVPGGSVPPSAASQGGAPEVTREPSLPESKPEAVTPSSPVEEFGAVLRRVEEASQAWNIHTDLAEGRFVNAMMAAIGWAGRLTQTSQTEWQALFKSQRDAAETELARAREITKAVSAALGQARSALLGLQVERENVAVRMMHETMPLFVTMLKDVLVKRDKALAEVLRWRALTMVSLVTLGVFAGGYGLRVWSDSDALGALGNCLAHAVQAQGHVYCDVTSFRGTGR